MALDIRMEVKLGQNLVISKRLQQAIKLLQYNHMEIVAHVEEAILENPTLEVVPDSASEGVDDSERAIREKVEATQQDVVEQNNGDEGGVDWERFIEQMSQQGPSLSTGGGTIYDDLPPIETNLTYGTSLADHLLFQLHMIKCGADERKMAEGIIHNLDHRGYLEVDLDTLSEDVGVEPEIGDEALELIQSLDPLGCGARDLCECLMIQARVFHPEDDTFEKLFTTQHLSNLERRNYNAIAKDLELELEDVVEYHKMLQEFEPLPGRGFSGDDARYITPDIYVVKHQEEWVVTLNEDGLPDLKISGYYQKVLSSASKDDKKYLIEKLKGAEFLITSIHRRRNTIRRVMESILKFQADFFENGAKALKPLILQDVATDIEMHMSTVSRVTTNKYVHTPHGTFELKYFFSAAVPQSGGGSDMAAEAIKQRIKGMVSKENPKKPLSDQAIANRLKEHGVRVARRTVAKYREQLGILPSSKRKQMF